MQVRFMPRKLSGREPTVSPRAARRKVRLQGSSGSWENAGNAHAEAPPWGSALGRSLGSVLSQSGAPPATARPLCRCLHRAV